jgi:asparagine synthase (glutamine-hydrolysing)
MTFAEQAHRLRDLLGEVTRYHLIADVPVGIFLSGGIDSSAAAALMTRQATYPVHSFSVGLDEPHQDMDERGAARTVAQEIGTQHFELVIHDSEALQLFEDFVRKIDQPSEDGANTMAVAAFAAEHGLKVVLSGVGMDELLGGYPTHLWAQRLGWFPGVAWPLGRQMLRRVHEIRPNRYSQMMMAAVTPRQQRCRFFREHIPEGRVYRALPSAVRSHVSPSKWHWPEHVDALNGYLYQEIYGYLTNTLLRDADAMTMASSIELRPLFVDHKFVEFCFALPGDSKCRDGRGKAVLREALHGLVPEFALARRKQGFGLPKHRWMNGPLKSRYIGLLAGETAKHVLSEEGRKRELARVQAGRADWTAWTVATLLAWIEQHRLEVAW